MYYDNQVQVDMLLLYVHLMIMPGIVLLNSILQCFIVNLGLGKLPFFAVHEHLQK